MTEWISGALLVAAGAAIATVIQAIAKWQLSIREHENNVDQRVQKDAISAYAEINNRVLEANQQLHDQLTRLLATNDQLQEKIDKLQVTNQQLSKEIAELKEELRQLRVYLASVEEKTKNPKGT